MRIYYGIINIWTAIETINEDALPSSKQRGQFLKNCGAALVGK